MIRIPNTDKKWSQPNTGEVLGNLFATRNMNFDFKGYAKLAKRSTALHHSVTNYGAVISISTLDGTTYYIMTSDHIFSCALSGAPSDMNGAGHIGGQYYDGITWQGRWYISQANDVSYYDGSNWTATVCTGKLVGGSKYHPLCVHEGLNYLAIGEDNTVFLFDSTHTYVRTITVPSNFRIRWMRYNNNYLYIGTENLKGGDAMIFIADGTSTLAQYGIIVPNSNWAFSGVIHQGVLVIINSRGQLLKYNGSGFDEIAHLPVYDTAWSWNDSTGATWGKVAQRGMVSKGEKIYINLDGYINSPTQNQLSNQPSGVWCHDPAIGLYHKAGLGNDTKSSITVSSADVDTDIFTTGSTITAPTGTKILLYSGTLTGLTVSNFYYLIYLTPTTFKVASSYNNAIAGTAVNLIAFTSAVFIMHDDVSFGETCQSAYLHGAMILINENQAGIASFREYEASQMLFGAAVVIPYTGGSGAYTLQSLTVGENRGSIVTPKIQNADIKGAWTRLIAKYGNLFQGNDKVIIKYRVTDKENYPLYLSSLTWTDSLTFTTTTDLSSVSVGDEIEICSGRGSGCCVHVSSVALSLGTWTVVIDEAIPAVTAGDVSSVFFQNWIKKGSATITTINQFFDSSIPETSKWIQLKIELRGVSEPYMEELQIINKTFQAGL